MGLEALSLYKVSTSSEKGCASSGPAIMEAVAAWDGPCEFQLANWTTEEPVAGLPVEYASIDIPDAYGPQAYEYDVQLQHHLAEYYSAASQQNIIATSEKAKILNDDSDARSSEVKKVVGQFKDDMNMMEEKMHKFPAYLGAVDKSYTVPRIVALGPYHHGLEHLKQAEEVKQVAACHCTEEGKFLKEMYEEFIPVAIDARRLYDKDAIAGISDEDFYHMMFFDACFLVQYMLMRSSRRRGIHESLERFMRPNRADIFHDVMLLENQLPWTVVDKVMRLLNVSWTSKVFVTKLRYCMMPYDYRKPPEPKPFIWYEDYNPPHLLGLLRYYIVGRRCKCDDEEKPKPERKNMSFSVSAMDLAEIGITLKANKTMQLIDMHLNQKGPVFTELCLAPLSLDRNRASYLINMAALELCVVESFVAAKEEDSAVCSYVLLLANLVYREEEVQVLRERGIMQRGGGLTNQEALRFFANFQVPRMGLRYLRIMEDIAIYRKNSLIKTELHGFFHNHKKAIAAVVTGIGAVGGIIGTLLSIKKSI